MLLSTIVPIPKDKRKSLINSNNYRSIALSSVIGTVFDNVILVSQTEILPSNNSQIGFKTHHSTTQCTFVLQETIDYFVSKGSPCYVILLDASKAFDRVHYGKLFEILRDRGLCPTLSKLLLNMYVNQKLRVRWNDTLSQQFDCRNGVKQGAVLSPILFCVYMDELLRRLKKSNYGCHIGTHYLGAVSYADDLTLIAPSLSAAREMLKICQKFSEEYHVQFNSQKSKLLTYGTNKTAFDLKLNNNTIPHVNVAKHLGNYIGNVSNKRNIENACREIKVKTNMIITQFRFCNSYLKSKLFSLYCNVFYGSSLWNLNVRCIDSLCVTWRKCVRLLCGLDSRARSWILPFLIHQLPVNEMLLLRFGLFLKNCLCSVNRILQFVSRMSVFSSSIVGCNFRLLMYKMNINSQDMYDINTHCFSARRIFLDNYHKQSRSAIDVIEFAKELIKIRDGEYHSVIGRNEAI